VSPHSATPEPNPPARLRLKEALRNSWFSPRHLSVAYAQRAISASRQYVRGVLLDVGCGLRQYEAILGRHVEAYIGMDWPVRPETSRPDVVGDALHIPFLDNSVDTVLATESMEHLPDPELFIAEVARVLRPGGSLILSVPFMEPLHEEPRDYYRFTSYGLRTLLQKHGFSVVRVWTKGGWWSVVLGSFASKALYELANPEVRRDSGRDRWWTALPVLPLCAVVQLTAYLLDHLLGSSQKYTLGYVVVANRLAATLK